LFASHQSSVLEYFVIESDLHAPMFLLLYNLPVQIFQQVNLTLKSGVACFNQIYLVIIVVKATHHFEGCLLFAFRIQH